MSDQDSRVVLVTGGARGIGRATVERFLEEGAEVWTTIYQSHDEVEVLEKLGVHCITTDLRTMDGMWFVVDELKKRGRLDVLVNNAGAIYPGADISNCTEELWEDTFAINTKAPFELARGLAPLMFAQKSGVIINVASIFGWLATPQVFVYTAAKAALLQMNRTMAKDYAPYIRVNAVSPGVIDTDMTRSGSTQLVKKIEELTPLQRIGRPEEVAQMIYLLASSQASFVTGTEIIVDGGLSLTI